jgi:hypothetical protein
VYDEIPNDAQEPVVILTPVPATPEPQAAPAPESQASTEPVPVPQPQAAPAPQPQAAPAPAPPKKRSHKKKKPAPESKPNPKDNEEEKRATKKAKHSDKPPAKRPKAKKPVESSEKKRADKAASPRPGKAEAASPRPSANKKRSSSPSSKRKDAPDHAAELRAYKKATKQQLSTLRNQVSAMSADLGRLKQLLIAAPVAAPVAPTPDFDTASMLEMDAILRKLELVASQAPELPEPDFSDPLPPLFTDPVTTDPDCLSAIPDSTVAASDSSTASSVVSSAASSAVEEPEDPALAARRELAFSLGGFQELSESQRLLAPAEMPLAWQLIAIRPEGKVSSEVINWDPAEVIRVCMQHPALVHAVVVPVFAAAHAMQYFKDSPRSFSARDYHPFSSYSVFNTGLRLLWQAHPTDQHGVQFYRRALNFLALFGIMPDEIKPYQGDVMPWAEAEAKGFPHSHRNVDALVVQSIDSEPSKAERPTELIRSFRVDPATVGAYTKWQPGNIVRLLAQHAPGLLAPIWNIYNIVAHVQPPPELQTWRPRRQDIADNIDAILNEVFALSGGAHLSHAPPVHMPRLVFQLYD